MVVSAVACRRLFHPNLKLLRPMLAAEGPEAFTFTTSENHRY